MVDFIVSKTNRLILERFNGKVNYDLIKQASEAIWAEPNYDPYFNGLIDIRDCKIEAGIAELSKAALFFMQNAHTAKGLLVILADQNQSIAKSFIFNNKVNKFMNIHVVSSLSEAMKNLGVPVEVYQLLDSDQVRTVG